MRLRKMILLLFILGLTGTIGAQTTYEFETYEEGSSKDIFSDGEKITFRLNTSDNQDYNITVRKDGNTIVDDKEMTNTQSEFYQIYDYNHTLSSPTGGDWKAYINMTTTGETRLTENEFYVATDEPRIAEANYPEQAKVEEDTTVEFKISDSESNWKNASIDLENSASYELDQIETGDNYALYQKVIQLSETGKNQFSVAAWDDQDNFGNFSGVIDVYKDTEDSSYFDINVNSVCRADVTFEPPGAEIANKYSVMATGAAENFTANIANNANTNISKSRANLTVDTLNITFEGEEELEYEDVDFKNPGANLSNGTFVRTVHDYENFTDFNGTQNSTNVPRKNIPDSNGNISEWRNNSFLREFNRSEADRPDVLGDGWYSGRVYGKIDCGFEVNNITDRFDFNLVALEDVERGGASETGPDESEKNPQDGPSLNGSGDPNPKPGDSSDPGETLVPEPEPEPEPIPQLSMDVEPLENTYTGRAGEFIPANLSVTNEGTESLTGLTVEPQIQNRTGWEVSNAQISSLSVDQTVYREVLIQPSESTDTGLYVIPVLGSNPENDLDIDYFNIEVIEDETVTLSSQMQIVESPRSLSVVQNTSTPLPILIENRGQTNLTNISGRLQNIGQCGEVDIGNIDKIESGETESLNFSFNAAATSQSCNTTLILSSDEGAYSFSKISFTVTPEEGLIPEKYRVPLIAVVWTALLALFAVAKRRYEIDSGLIKAPFVLLVAGEALIFMYLLVDYYQLVSASFLPF